MKFISKLFLIGIILLSGCNSNKEKPVENQNYAALTASRKPLESKQPSFQSTSINLMAESNFYLLNQEKGEFYVMAKVIGGEDTVQNKRTPLNISLVVDRSGSMESENKLVNVKKACKLVVSNLTEVDKLSIVTYESEVDVVHESSLVKNKSLLEQKISKIQTDGSTNLSGGMLEGFAQVLKTYEDKAVNRVLLLSDGLANQGIVEVSKLQEIVQRKYNDDNIAISTFGVGKEFNEDLMTNIAEYGRGNYYFINSSDEIPEIFKNELEGLLSVVAQNTKLELAFPNEFLEVEKVFGYEYEVKKNKLIVDYNDVFAKEEKVVLIKFKFKDLTTTSTLKFNASLTYDDVLSGYERITRTDDLSIELAEDKKQYEEGMNTEVQRNIIIFNAIDNFEQAAKKIDEGEYDKAKELMRLNIDYMKNNKMLDIEKDTILLKQYENYKNYSKEIENIERMRAEEKQMLQKSNKNINYRLKKKKKQ